VAPKPFKNIVYLTKIIGVERIKKRTHVFEYVEEYLH
jgi:hypothetical protein